MSQTEQICQQILEQQPNQVEALQLLGKLEEAIACYNHVLELNPQLIDAQIPNGTEHLPCYFPEILSKDSLITSAIGNKRNFLRTIHIPLTPSRSETIQTLMGKQS